jgi:type II secretory pathway component GspD/PulD (secretin)
VKRQSLVLAVAALSLSFSGSKAYAQVPSLDARVNLRIAEQNLEDVVALLRDRSGANIVVIDPKEGEPISKTKLSIDLSDLAWRDALELVAEKSGLVVETRTGGVLAVVKSPRVEFEFQNREIGEVIDTIAKISGANVVIGPEVVGTISVRFKGVPWRAALEVVAKTRGYTVVDDNRGVLRVVDPKTLQDQLETRTYQLRFLRPKSIYKPLIKSEFLQATGGAQAKGGGGGAVDYMKTFTVLQALGKALSGAGVIDYIETQNVVIVRDTSQVHDSIKDMIARLDVEPVQVFCDVKFVSTSNADVLNLGVDYGDQGPQVTVTGGQIPVTLPFNLGRHGWEDGIIVSPNGGGPYADPALNSGDTIIPETIFGALSFTQVQATLRMLQRDTATEVIQAPKLIALDGKEATIFVGETIRYAEAKSEQGQAGGFQLSVTEASGSPIDVGFQLLILPNVIPGTSKIQMEVIPKETSLSGTGQTALAPPGFDVFTIGAGGLAGSIALPRTRSSTIVTTMMVESGQPVVIGGLTTDIDQKSETRVPYLSAIPLIGELFKYESENRERRSLLVFITPTIVHSREDQELLLQQELSRRRASLKDEIEKLVDVQPASATTVQ